MARGSAPGERRGGRQKGALNKRTRELIEILDARGYCAVSELIEVGALARKEYERAEEIYDAIQEKRISHDLVPLTESVAPTYLKIMQQSAAELMPYMYPKRKAIELTGKDGADFLRSFADIIKQVADGPE
jgi:hypothetical protein